MKYFKCVVAKKGKLFSTCLGLPDEQVSIEYVPDEFVESPHGPLFVFDNVNDALSFTTDSFNIQIWECEIEGLRRTKKDLRILPAVSLTVENVEKFWNDFVFGYYDLVSSFDGTTIVDKVKLIRRMR